LRGSQVKLDLEAKEVGLKGSMNWVLWTR